MEVVFLGEKDVCWAGGKLRAEQSIDSSVVLPAGFGSLFLLLLWVYFFPALNRL